MGRTESRCTVITQKPSVAEEPTHGIEVLLTSSFKVSLCSRWQEATWLVGIMGAQAQVIWYYVVPSSGLRGTCMPGGGPNMGGEKMWDLGCVVLGLRDPTFGDPTGAPLLLPSRTLTGELSPLPAWQA